MNLNVVSVHIYLLFQSKNEVKNRFLFFVFCIFFPRFQYYIEGTRPQTERLVKQQAKLHIQIESEHLEDSFGN